MELQWCNEQIANRDLKLKSISIRKAKAAEDKLNKNTKVQSLRSGFCDFSKCETIETNWSRDGPRLKSDNLRRDCKLQDNGAVQKRSEPDSRQRERGTARSEWDSRTWFMK